LLYTTVILDTLVSGTDVSGTDADLLAGPGQDHETVERTA
jgi:hypothetical protein